TLWVDQSGNLLPPVVAVNQEMKRGSEPPPSQALGIRQEFITPSLVEGFALEPDDQVLLYSDGIDKVLSPAKILAVLKEGQQSIDAVKRNDGQQSIDAVKRILDEIVTPVLNEVEINRGDDDRSFLIAVGPHVPFQNAEYLVAREQLEE